MASGKALLGIKPERRLKGFYFAAQDGQDETERRIAAFVQHHGLGPSDLHDCLYTGDGRRTPFTLVEPGAEGAVVDEYKLEAAIEFLKKRRIDVAVFDPLRWVHSVDENSNSAMGVVAEAFALIARHADCAVELIHHARKVASGQTVDVGDTAGAGALVAAARSVRTLNQMSEKEASKARVASAKGYFRCDDGKANFAPCSEAPAWYFLADERLANGDQVGVVTPWRWPEVPEPTSKTPKARKSS
jgi:RecA-family ATPase